MLWPQNIICVLVSAALIRAAPNSGRQNSAEKFKEILRGVSDEAIHRALHQTHPAFKDGVYESDKAAAGALHSNDPPLASKVIELAQQELVRRQNANSSTSTPDQTSSSTSFTYTPPTSQQPIPSYPNTPPVVTPPSQTSVSRPEDSPTTSEPTPPTDTGNASPSTSNIPIITPIASQPPAESPEVPSASSQTGPSPSENTVNGGENGITTTDDVPNSAEPPEATGGASTPTSPGGAIVTSTTPRPQGTPVQSVVYTTVTNQDGVASVVSSTVVIYPEQSGTPDTADAASASGSPSPGLQTGAADRVAIRADSGEMLGLLGGVIGLVLLI